MKFVVEKMELTDAGGVPLWNGNALPYQCCETEGLEAENVLRAVVSRDGGVELGIRATFVDGHAVTVARKGDTIYALRAMPL